METVAVYLGAVRSLSTISSAMMALHPEVTVLNHGFRRILADPQNDFLRTPARESLSSFARTAAAMSLDGRQGAYGGHILHSHAFHADGMLRQAYLNLYGWQPKSRTKCLLWKEPTKVTNHIAHHKLDVGAVARALRPLRFLALVRNPVDIAISSIRKGYSEQLVGPEKAGDFGAVFGQIVSRFGWFSRFAAEQPDQFRFVFQDELLNRTHLIGRCEFLRLSAPEKLARPGRRADPAARLLSDRGRAESGAQGIDDAPRPQCCVRRARGRSDRLNAPDQAATGIGRVAAAASRIGTKSAAVRLQVPTSKPSTPSIALIQPALLGLTDPP
jgi:hypothetical protein